MGLFEDLRHCEEMGFSDDRTEEFIWTKTGTRLGDKALNEKEGAAAAKKWLTSADPAEIVRVAGYDFDYGLDTLDTLQQQGLQVPSSSDPDYSWGFYKQVKGHVTHKVWSDH